MIEKFPYGKAPFWLLVLAVVSTALLLVTTRREIEQRPDLIFATFAPPHLDSYRRALPAFERRHGARVSIQLVTQRALETRLQNALLAGTEVPDMVEIMEGGLGFFTKGPLEDVGFVDLTERVARDDLRRKMVESRFSLWSSRGRVFALPHDVHPVMLLYRADLVEALGIDVSRLQTWADFAEAGRKVTRDLDGDGVVDRYMLDMPAAGGFALNLLLLQRGVGSFDEQGAVAFNRPETVATFVWILRQYYGPGRIGYEAGWGQSLMKALTDGLVLFLFAPDWRSYAMESEIPNLRGKVKLMPLPAWERGGRRTSVWGGTGLTITRRCRKPELAWELAKYLYLDKPALGQRFASTNILPPLKEAWTLPELSRPNAYYSGQPIGAMYAELAPETPPVWSTPYRRIAENKLGEAFLRAADHYQRQGEVGLEEFIRAELGAAEAYVQKLMARNLLAQQEH
jgi:arabinosaccharide transport system substrate-binding protein